MGLIQNLLDSKKKAKCVNCYHMVVISDNAWGCLSHDKLIIPDMPPYHGQAECVDFKIRESEE